MNYKNTKVSTEGTQNDFSSASAASSSVFNNDNTNDYTRQYSTTNLPSFSTQNKQQPPPPQQSSTSEESSTSPTFPTIQSLSHKLAANLTCLPALFSTNRNKLEILTIAAFSIITFVGLSILLPSRAFLFLVIIFFIASIMFLLLQTFTKVCKQTVDMELNKRFDKYFSNQPTVSRKYSSTDNGNFVKPTSVKKNSTIFIKKYAGPLSSSSEKGNNANSNTLNNSDSSVKRLKITKNIAEKIDNENKNHNVFSLDDM